MNRLKFDDRNDTFYVCGANEYDCKQLAFVPRVEVPGIAEGQSVKCGEAESAVYRYTGGELRHYPNSAIADTWDKTGASTRTAGIPRGAPRLALSPT
jgi:hypothetical protein